MPNFGVKIGKSSHELLATTSNHDLCVKLIFQTIIVPAS